MFILLVINGPFKLKEASHDMFHETYLGKQLVGRHCLPSCLDLPFAISRYTSKVNSKKTMG